MLAQGIPGMNQKVQEALSVETSIFLWCLLLSFVVGFFFFIEVFLSSLVGWSRLELRCV